MKRTRATTRVSAALLVTALIAQASAQSTRQVARIDETGLHIDTILSNQPDQPPMPAPHGGGIIWQFTDPISITQSVCVADTTDETWVGHYLNSERMAHHQTTGSGIPDFEFPIPDVNPGTVAVASAEDVSLGVNVVTSAANPPAYSIIVRGFNSGGGNVPIWTYNFAAQYLNAGNRAADVSADGSIVAVVANTAFPPTARVVILNGATGDVLNSLDLAAGANAIELSADGSRAVITEGATARVIETTGMTELHSFAVSGTGGYARISRDGLTVAHGGFNLRVFRNTGLSWNQIYTASLASNWLGNGIALSANGDTMFYASHTYTPNYLVLTYRVVDLVSGLQTAQIMTAGTGAQQDTVQGAEASADGEIFAVASWGTQDNVHPEVQIFDSDLNLIGGIDSPGSAFSLDMTADGIYLVTGGKSVHANISGNGSNTYAYEIASACGDGDVNGDSVVNTDDAADFVNVLLGLDTDPDHMAAADVSCDGTTNGLDVSFFLDVLL